MEGIDDVVATLEKVGALSAAKETSNDKRKADQK